MAKSKSKSKFVLVEGDLTADKRTSLDAALEKADALAKKVSDAKSAWYKAEEKMHDLYRTYTEEMARFAELAKAHGVTIEVVDSVVGYEFQVGANDEGTEPDYWMPSSICW